MTDPLVPVAACGFTGVVLCGGSSRRMGRDKALIEIDGVAMARRVADALQVAGASNVLAVGGDANALRALGFDVHPDDRPGDGPLPATICALGAAREPVVMVLSCDLLHPSALAIGATVLALGADTAALGAVPFVDGHRQWMHAAWRREAAHALSASYASGARSLRRAAADLRLVEVVGIDPVAVADADEPGDLACPPSGVPGWGR